MLGSASPRRLQRGTARVRPGRAARDALDRRVAPGHRRSLEALRGRPLPALLGRVERFPAAGVRAGGWADADGRGRVDQGVDDVATEPMDLGELGPVRQQPAGALLQSHPRGEKTARGRTGTLVAHHERDQPRAERNLRSNDDGPSRLARSRRWTLPKEKPRGGNDGRDPAASRRPPPAGRPGPPRRHRPTPPRRRPTHLSGWPTGPDHPRDDGVGGEPRRRPPLFGGWHRSIFGR